MEEYKYPIEKCKNCNRFNHEEGKMKNKLKCMFSCEDYILDQSTKAFEYNRSVSGEEFDKEIIYEHGKKVFGSGWNKDWN